MDLMMYVPDKMNLNKIDQLTPKIIHNCEIPKIDMKYNIMTEASYKTRFWYFLFSKRTIAFKYPFIKWLKNNAAINYEINRHFQSYPYMIHPFSIFRIYWKMIMIITGFITLIINPIFLAFYMNEKEQWYMFSNVLDGIILCDIIMCFFTGYYNHWTNMVILNPRIIAKKYMKSTFIVDILSAIPYQLIDFIINKSVWYCVILNIVKIIRIRAIIVYSRKLCCIYHINRQRYKLFEMSMIIIISIHWAACLEYYIPLTVSNIFGRNRGSWIESDALKERKTNCRKYLICLNRAIIALVCSAHYLDMKTPDDILLNIVLSIMGILGFIYILAQIMQFINTLYSTTKKHYKHFQQLKEYIRYKELPYNLQRRILEYFNYCSKKNFNRYQHIIHQVSSYLQEKLILHTYMKFINNVSLFQYIPESIVLQLINVLSSEIYLENDIIVKTDEEGDGLYFIASGTVAVYNILWKEVCHLEDGAYFGDIFLFLKSMHHNANIVAIETCEIYILYRTNFQLIMKSYPDLFNVLYNEISKYVKKPNAYDSFY
ncbi:potassium/sodium hyperpolarization-activated cyclic nucleotide-gated channel 1-like [Vespa mandarinia]|uniref:potassium/sodium hyperpolarization-activated cyclic nucleotide-gated channel 1-like n=1 Tax=Vespa mandarinia TaxID=7446 RepID=UPI001618416E|nr:potassium/sodium hyperpolarization-activated cyclic nucleotide-gated channel 1-like [Vespa mandarinia]